MDILKKIEEQLKAGFPFAVFCKPGSNKVTGIFRNDALAHCLSEGSGRGFVMAPFSGKKVIYIQYEGSDIVSEELQENDIDTNAPEKPGTDPKVKAAFEALVIKSVNAINEGHFDKLVTSRSEIAETNIAPAELYRRLLAAYPLAYRYCFYTPETGLWMGATPEQLLKAENHTLHTVALAGTQVYQPDVESVWEQKERREQEFVTEYILNELKDFVTETSLRGPYTFRAGNLVHLKTDISAEIKPGMLLDNIVQKLHPTPAVCGLPKQDAAQFLLENEGYNREYYAGYLGEWEIDLATGYPKTDLFVNLRCMKVAGTTAQLFIGCGITADSDPEKEFYETVNKSMTMRRVL